MLKFRLNQPIATPDTMSFATRKPRQDVTMARRSSPLSPPSFETPLTPFRAGQGRAAVALGWHIEGIGTCRLQPWKPGTAKLEAWSHPHHQAWFLSGCEDGQRRGICNTV